MTYMIYGAGSPLRMEAPSPEIAEAHAVERFGLRIENLVTVRFDDDMLSGRCVTGSTEGSGRDSDSE
tara:strand:+ start:318 stop:518 length:201 start_codon:yes stop_codon:yes gene_type:complete